MATAGLLLSVGGLALAPGPASGAEAVSGLRALNLVSSSSAPPWVTERLPVEANAHQVQVSADGDHVSWCMGNSVLLLDLRTGMTIEIFSNTNGEDIFRIPRDSSEELQPVFDDGYSLFAAASAGAFSDVSLSPYRTAIEELAALGVIGGYDDGTYRPKNPLLRAQFAKIVGGALGFVATEGLTSPFVDLGADDPFDLYPHEFMAVSWMKGITLGKTARTFEPFRPVLRAQAISMAIRGVKSILPEALAVPAFGFSSTWGNFDPDHSGTVRVAEYNGLLAGLPLADLNPWGAMNREEAAQLLNSVRILLAQAIPATVRGTASDPALADAIRTGWPELGDLSLPTELPQGWRLSDANLGFWYVPMGEPPTVCAYGVEYTNGQEAIELSAGYWPASGGSRYFHELAESATPVDIFLEGDQWKTFAYRDYPTEPPTHQVLFVELTDTGSIGYVEIDYSPGGAKEVAEEIARTIARVR